MDGPLTNKQTTHSFLLLCVAIKKNDVKDTFDNLGQMTQGKKIGSQEINVVRVFYLKYWFYVIKTFVSKKVMGCSMQA